MLLIIYSTVEQKQRKPSCSLRDQLQHRLRILIALEVYRFRRCSAFLRLAIRFVKMRKFS